MLKTKIVSSQQKAFIDDKIDKFPKLESISVLRGEKLSFQLLYVDEGEEYLPVRPYCNLEIKGALASHVTVRDVRNVPVDRPVHPEKHDANYLRTTPGIYPDVLTPLRYGGKVTVARDKLRSLWIELEIPEVQDGTILIKGVSREAGSRTKIAVESRDENVDAVGSCIGKNGMRINAILNELCGEKIDIIKYSDVIEEYVAEALSPAKVISVTMDGERSCRVTVAPEQLSLAIGKEGQNAKLVARLTGCKIDIKA
jgi:transcription antitermination factor NusA-like protein